MSEIINYTRLTTSDKVDDKFLTCQSYVPQDKDKAEQGVIFSHVEIASPWFGSTQVGQSIINTLIREYYRGDDSSELNNFEEAIKKVNESLAKSAQNGETEWIGRLSSVLILLNKTEVHFAQTGKSHAYLYRGGRVNHITEGLEQEDAPHPLKTFSNLTSGSLQEGDKIVVANESFFEIINPNELRLIVSSLPPTAAALECAKIIQMHGINDANAIFIELTTKEALANLQPDQKLEAVYLDHQVLGISALSKNAMINIGTTFGGLVKHGFEAVSKTVSPIAKKGLEKSKERSRIAFEKTKEAAAEKIQKLDDKVSEASLHKEVNSWISKISGVTTKLTLKLKNKLRRNLIRTGIYGREKSKMYAILLIPVAVLLFAAIFFGVYQQKNNDKQKDLQAKHNQIISLEGESSILISKNNTTEALAKLKQIITLADSLGSTRFAEEAKSSKQKADAKIIDITRLTKIDPQQVIPVSQPKSIELSGDSITVIATNQFFYKTLDEPTLSKGFDLGFDSSDSALSSTALDEKNLAVISKNKKMSKIDLVKNNTSILNVDLKNPGIIKSFDTNIYLLDNIDSQIYKINNKDGALQSPAPYLKEKVDFSSIVSFTIDGSVFTLSSDGQISKYSRGTLASKIAFELPASEKMKNYSIIKTTESSDHLYILSNDGSSTRLIQIKKSGGFVKQFRLQNTNAPKDFAIDEANNRLFLLDDSSLLTYSLN